jgi:2-keto-4-pentenoate hydratase/2-oxohepta-3-ene-1,7-dioic acid hydratase in catechol pathway
LKIARFINRGSIYFGAARDDGTALRIEGNIFSGYSVTTEEMKIEKLLAPVVPTDILCIGLNYRQHAAESQMEVPKHPMLFIKASNSLNNPLDPIRIPRLSNQIDYEGELAVVIAKDAKDVSRDEALKYVLGYTIANDVTARDWQRDKSLGGGQFARGKSFDTFCPLGPWMVTADEIPNPNVLGLRTLLNGQVMQDSNTRDMIFDVPSLIASLSSTMTVRTGAVILTGTPHGVGMGRTPVVWMKRRDEVVVEIEQIGRLENPVA